jgi:hypothetical protein
MRSCRAAVVLQHRRPHRGGLQAEEEGHLEVVGVMNVASRNDNTSEVTDDSLAFFCLSAGGLSLEEFIGDTGASSHMAPSLHHFHLYMPFASPK